MKRRLINTLITLALAASLTGCAMKYPTYYTLHLPPAVDMPKTDVSQPSVAVCEFRSPAYLRQGAIVYRPSPEVVGYYNYQRWAVDPRESLTTSLVDRLRASGRFSGVKIYDGRADVDLILNGNLEKLEEVDFEGGVRVEVVVTAQMTDLRSGKMVWANAASETAAVNKRTMPSVVDEMSQAMDSAIRKLLASLPASLPTHAQ